jgi:hypothetical protein
MNASICSCKSSTEVNDAPFSDHVPGHQGTARRRRRHSAGGVIVVRVNGLHELRAEPGAGLSAVAPAPPGRRVGSGRNRKAAARY